MRGWNSETPPDIEDRLTLTVSAFGRLGTSSIHAPPSVCDLNNVSVGRSRGSRARLRPAPPRVE